MTDKIIRVKIETGDSPQQINQLDNSMVKLGASTDRTTEEVAQLNTQMTKTAQGVSQATGKIGQVAQQAGFQIQDFANQVAGGQSALLAFGQQAPQFLGTFGPGGAVFGAIIAVSAAIGGVLVNAIKSAKEEAQELPGEVKKFAEEIGKKFANVDLSSRADLARVEIGKLNTEYEKTAEKLAAVTAELKDLDTFGPSSKFVKSGEQYTKAWSDANYEVKENTAKLDIIKQKLEQLNTISQTGLGTQSLDALADSSVKTATATDNLNQSLQIQEIALKKGELAAKLQAAANYLELDSVEKLPEETRKRITEIYNLEQAQKRQTETQAELNQEISEQAKLDLQAIKDDAEKARRAERDKQRINERIANMRLETQTLSAESELQRAVKLGQFTQEEADLASQTAARLLAANSEFEQTIAMQGIQHEQIEAAEIAHKDRIKAINEQYAEAQVQLKQYQFNREVQAYQGFANSAIQLVNAFGSKSFQAQKNAAIATSLVNIAGGVAQALNNPYPANLGFAAQVAAEGASLLSAIKSTNINSGGGSLAIGGGASATIPTAPTAAPVVGSFEIAGLADLQRQLDNLDNDEVLPVSFTRRLVASLESVQRLDGAS